MMKMNTKMLVAAAGALLATGPLHAGTASGVVGIKAKGVANCTVTGGGALLDFGTIPSGTTTNNIDQDTTGAGSTPLIVNCNGAFTSPLMTYGPGLNDAGGAHYMINAGGAKVLYGLYSDASRTIIEDAGDSRVPANFVNGDNPVIIYGRIPAGQIIPIGDLNDTVPVTFTF